MRMLNLNCQRALNPNFKAFFQRSLSGGKHNILLLQEANEKVMNLAKNNLEKYNILRHKTPKGSFSELCILYSKRLRCIDSDFSYIEDPDGNEFGVLMAVFKSKKYTFSTANVHLPAYFKPKKRLLAIRHVKNSFNKFLKKHPKVSRVIMAGDFNSILPWENKRNRLILAPFLSPVKNKRSYTYRSELLEPIDIWSKFIYYLGRLGISFRPALDHVFANKKMIQKKWIRAKAQKKRVSDHLPILITVR